MILTGWKEVSEHLRYSVRTLQRWERSGLPVKRVNSSSRSPVVADSEELDGWILHQSLIPPGAPKKLLDNLRPSKELQDEIAQRRDEFQQRVQAFRKEIAEFRTKRQQRSSKRDSGGVR